MISLIPYAEAATNVAAQAAAKGFVAKINEFILFPLITLMMSIAFLVFLYGAFEYVRNATSESGRETGRQHLFYGVIGMLVMLSAMAILSIAAGTFGLSDVLNDAKSPVSSSNSPFAPSTSLVPPSRPDGLGATAPADTITVTTLPDEPWMVLQDDINDSITNPDLQATLLTRMTTGDDQKFYIQLAAEQGVITQETRDLMINQMDSTPVDEFGTALITDVLDSTDSSYTPSLANKDYSVVTSSMTSNSEEEWQSSYEVMTELRSKTFISQETYDEYLVFYNNRIVYDY